MHTVVGSCVSVCLWDKVKRIGGMNHFLLPLNPNRQGKFLKYGDTATEFLIDSLLQRGCFINQMNAYIVGGSFNHQKEGGKYRIGERNYSAALKVLNGRNIEVLSCDTGGDVSRKITFNCSNGNVYIEHMVRKNGRC